MRQKALAAVDRGGKKFHVSWMFGISRNTLANRAGKVIEAIALSEGFHAMRRQHSMAIRP